MKPREGWGRCGNAIFALLCAIVIASVGTTGWALGSWGHYTDPTGAIVYYWNDPLNVKFKYTTTRQWWDYSTVNTTWYTLTTTGSSGAFIGDGSWRDLGNGFVYSYNVTNDMAWFKKGVDGRFGYYYAPGRWMMAGNSGGWQLVGNAGLSANFLGDAAWHDLGNGFTYSYSLSSDLGWYKRTVGGGRFGYYYAPSRWMSTGNSGGWQYIGNAGLSASFLGDAGWHDLGNGFTYSYAAASDLGWFRVGTTGRYGYSYTPGQWMTTGNSGGWQLTGNAGLSASFLGDGGWHTLGNGFIYSYVIAPDMGWFKAGMDGRFGYYYTPSRWITTGNYGGWQYMGAAGLSTSFLGDGSGHALGNGFTYTYTSGTADYGTFTLTTGGANRFQYGYTTGQWQHYGAGSLWADLGNAGLSASFMGDGLGHNLGTWHQPGTGNWWFTYSAGTGYTDDQGQWSLADGANHRFAYGYNAGQWFDYDGFGSPLLGWVALGDAGVNLGDYFIGDGSGHNLGTWHQPGTGNWWFTYSAGTGYTDDRGQWSLADGANNRFAYGYNAGQWYHNGALGGWGVLGSAGNSALFIGDGAWNRIADGSQPWYYYYHSGNDAGFWARGAGGADQRFSYFYSDSLLGTAGQWKHYDSVGGNNTIGAPVSLGTLAFIGDGGSHADNVDTNTWWYSYDYGADKALWDRSASGDGSQQRLSYAYASGQWGHIAGERGSLGSALLGATTNLGVMRFIGDGGRHADNVDTNTWWYSYDYGNDKALWDRSTSGDGSQLRFSYAYASGQWGHIAGVSGSLGSALLGDTTNLSAMRFIGLYASQQIVFGAQPWWYGYDYSQDGGGWSQVDPSGRVDVRFGYEYANGTWGHKKAGSLNFAVLGAVTGSSLNAFTSFAGDGGWGLVNGAPVWYYSYDYTANQGSWSLNAGGADKRFAFAYSSGQWSHYDAYGSPSPGWVALGDPGVALSDYFMGDGSAHSLGTWNHPGSGNWWFTYNAGTGSGDDQGQFSLSASGDNRFAYRYNAGQWLQFGGSGAGSWGRLSAAGLSPADFIGDGSPHTIGTFTTAWDFTYDAGTGPTVDRSYFSRSGVDRFRYVYADSQWYHPNVVGTFAWVQLGNSGALPDFIADGSGHNLGTWHQPGSGNWYFSYDAGTGASDDKGRFGLSFSGDYRFAYRYNDGQWRFYEQGTTWKSIGGTGQSLASFFIGDGSAHSLRSGASWTLQYVAADDRFLITHTTTGHQYLAYSFAGPYWMDGGNGYPLAQITGGSSPYWYWYDSTSRMYLSSSGPVYMHINLSDIYWNVTYVGAGDTWEYLAALARWFLSGANVGVGGPGLHRQ